MERCPACRARLAHDPVCGRCGCDFSLVRQAKAQAKQLGCGAIQAWLAGDREGARALAARSVALQENRLGRGVLRLLGGTS